jgi:hypothetical protein
MQDAPHITAPGPPPVQHVPVGIHAGAWEAWADRKPPIWALKELLDNALNKAEEDPAWLQNPELVPWNAADISVRLLLAGGAAAAGAPMLQRYLAVMDNGRGLTNQAFKNTFSAIGHNKRPGELQQGAISRFGTGSRLGDAILSKDVVYLTRSRQEPSDAIIARGGTEQPSDMPQFMSLRFCEMDAGAVWGDTATGEQQQQRQQQRLSTCAATSILRPAARSRPCCTVRFCHTSVHPASRACSSCVAQPRSGLVPLLTLWMAT